MVVVSRAEAAGSRNGPKHRTVYVS